MPAPTTLVMKLCAQRGLVNTYVHAVVLNLECFVYLSNHDEDGITARATSPIHHPWNDREILQSIFLALIIIHCHQSHNR